MWTLSAQTGGNFKGLLQTKPQDVKIAINPEMKENPLKFLSNSDEAFYI